ncbi:MAG: site-specific integrase [Opitutales bacterium]|nr:site-specific integrase [Opitutales bacterium]
MAYLRKVPESRFWIGCFRDRFGKLHNRSTKIPHGGETPKERAGNRRKAAAIADGFERIARGELKRESDIRETALALAAIARGEEVKMQTAREFLNEWVERQESAGKPDTTLARYRQVVRDFIASLEDEADFPVERIEPTHVQRYVDGLAARGLATKTRSNCLKILRVPFNEAVTLRRLTFNPAGAAKVGEKVRSVEKGAFSADELRAILAAAADFEHGAEWRIAIAFGFFCGARLGDACSMRWDGIDLAGLRLSFTPEKTKERIELPMHPQLAEMLMEAAGDEKEAVTPTLAAMAAKGRRAILSKRFLTILRAAGIETKQSGAGVRKVTDKTFHSLRHSLASHLSANNVPEAVRMKLTAHTDPRVHRSYTHAEFEQLRAALGNIETI